MSDETLIAALEEAENENIHARPCQVCAALEMMSEEARVRVERALAGTIGEEKLAKVLTDSGYPTGRRAVRKHRKGHPA